MQLVAISDLHIGYPANRRALEALPAFTDDWLIVAGDVGDSVRQIEFVWRLLVERFARVIWTPGNHDLWTLPIDPRALRGVAHYEQLVEISRRHGVVTPEDPYLVWPGEGPPTVIAPVFLLYDYSFRPDHVPEDQALAWAAEKDLVCADELLLHPDPYASRSEWCRARGAMTEQRLRDVPDSHMVVLVNHFPLRQDLAVLPRIPRFSIWCGTRLTNDWHTRFRARVVVSGHLHIRSTSWRDEVRFEEVSLGYPRQWNAEKGMEGYLRRIL